MYSKDLAEITSQIVVAALNNGLSSESENVADFYQIIHDKILELADADDKRFDVNRNKIHTAG